jgi:hypothetical protein
MEISYIDTAQNDIIEILFQSMEIINIEQDITIKNNQYLYTTPVINSNVIADIMFTKVSDPILIQNV